MNHCHWFIHDAEFFDRRYHGAKKKLTKPAKAKLNNAA